MCISTAVANDIEDRMRRPIDPTGISGSLMIAGGGSISDDIFSEFLRLAGDQESRLVVITTASANAGTSEHESVVQHWKKRGFDSVDVLHTLDRSIADTDHFCETLKQATAVWFVGGQQSRLSDVYVGTKVEDELHQLLKRGGVIGGTSAGAAIQSRLMIASGNPQATLMTGFDFLPGAVIDQHFKVRDRQSRLVEVISDHPDHFGIGVDERTAIVVQGRSIKVLGKSTATICLAGSSIREPLQHEISSGEHADLTALRRSAKARSKDTFPPRKMRTPKVPNGALFIVGGGRMTDELWGQFLQLAGGKEARIAIVPTANGGPSRNRNAEQRKLIDLGARDVFLLHTNDPEEADDESFAKQLDSATGIWFTGGRQWRIVDAYEDTKTCLAFHNVLKRGGVIGGSSAGATIQGDYLVRGNPLGNRDMMAEGYEKGFAFLPGCAIDQHFTQRKRLKDMESLKRTFPQILGIGIDESTALIVTGSTAKVVGENDVYFFDQNPNESTDEVEFTKTSTGDSYDLQTHKRNASQAVIQ